MLRFLRVMMSMSEMSCWSAWSVLSVLGEDPQQVRKDKKPRVRAYILRILVDVHRRRLGSVAVPFGPHQDASSRAWPTSARMKGFFGRLSMRSLAAARMLLGGQFCEALLRTFVALVFWNC